MYSFVELRINICCRYDPKKSSMISQDGDTKSKSQKRREICLSMLEEDILETDPKVV